jgi:hypothetical protein
LELSQKSNHRVKEYYGTPKRTIAKPILGIFLCILKCKNYTKTQKL